MKKNIFYHNLVFAAAVDEGNRSMRVAGRTVWNEDDHNAAVREYHRLRPCPKEVACDICNEAVGNGRSRPSLLDTAGFVD